MYKVSYLKLVLVIVFMLIVLSISYTGWKILNNNNKLGNLNNTSINIQDKYVEPKATNNQKISGIDTSDWKIYRNENYRFELKYPSVYVLNNRDIVRPILKSRYVILTMSH